MKNFLLLLWISALFSSELDTQIQQAMSFNGIGAMSVAIISDYKVVFAKGYGKTPSGTDVTHNTTFHANGFAAPFIAMAALKGVVDGNLSLTKDINQTLLYCKVPLTKKTRLRKVTLRNLLDHTSGISLGNTLEGVTMDRVPGRHYEDNPLNYAVIRRAMVDRYHESFKDVMNHIIFEPLGMKQTLFDSVNSLLITSIMDASKWVISFQKSVNGSQERILTTEMAKNMVDPQIDSEHACGFIAQRNAFGEHEKNGDWFIASGNTSLLIGNKEGSGVVILSDGGGDLMPILRHVVSSQKP